MKRKNKSTPKKVARHLVRFERDSLERRVTKLAMGCMCTREIAKRTGLSESQITFRLHKGKLLGGYKLTFRQQWKNGSPLFEQFMEDYSGVMELEIERRIVPALDHPTPKTVRVED